MVNVTKQMIREENFIHYWQSYRPYDGSKMDDEYSCPVTSYIVDALYCESFGCGTFCNKISNCDAYLTNKLFPDENEKSLS